MGGSDASDLYPPAGFLWNGRIVPSVAGNNITVALKGMDGNDPAAANPVYVRIDNAIRSITAPLSVTKNAGTNWFAAGSAEMATHEIDYFVYLGYNAVDGVVIGFARIPFGKRYDDFSAVTTNEKYCAISTITNAAAGDHYHNIGRFAATLSAGAGYTWTVPVFTAANLIQRPIYETRQLTWSPVHDRTGGDYTNLPVVDSATYQIIDNTLKFAEQHTQNAVPGGAGYQTMTLPFTHGLAYLEGGFGANNGSAYMMGVFVQASASYCTIIKYDGGMDAEGGAAYTATGHYWI